MIHLKLLEKEEQDNPKSDRQKSGQKSMNWRLDKSIQQINKTKSWLFEVKNK
jgi:hypothetical protein